MHAWARVRCGQVELRQLPLVNALPVGRRRSVGLRDLLPGNVLHLGRHWRKRQAVVQAVQVCIEQRHGSAVAKGVVHVDKQHLLSGICHQQYGAESPFAAQVEGPDNLILVRKAGNAPLLQRKASKGMDDHGRTLCLKIAEACAQGLVPLHQLAQGGLQAGDIHIWRHYQKYRQVKAKIALADHVGI